jgi:hypothetical protein
MLGYVVSLNADGVGALLVRTHRHALDLSVWVANVQIIEEEHAVKGLSEELYLRLLVNWPQSLHSSMSHTPEHIL